MVKWLCFDNLVTFTGFKGYDQLDNLQDQTQTAVIKMKPSMSITKADNLEDENWSKLVKNGQNWLKVVKLVKTGQTGQTGKKWSK